MRAFRIIVAALLAACAVPIVLFGLAWLLSAVNGCPLEFKERHVCTFASMNIGGLLDILVQYGVFGALTFGLGTYVFAGWVFVELAVVIVRSLRRPY